MRSVTRDRVVVCETAGFLLAAGFASALRGLWERSGRLPAVALIAPVNGSVWEGMKLLFVSLLAATLIEWPLLRAPAGRYLSVKARMLLLLPVLWAALRYTTAGASGYDLDAVNIAVGYALMAGLFIWSARSLLAGPGHKPVLSVAAVIAMCVLFAAFTSRTPRANMFRDPRTGVYGTDSAEVVQGAAEACLAVPAAQKGEILWA